MADNTAQSGSATIAADDVTSLNGGASSGVLVQRVKVQFGDDGTARDVSASFPLPVANAVSTLAVTATAALSVAATASLPAAGAGLFHYITGIQITAYSAAARTGSATPWVVTSTNLPGSPAWTFSTAGAIGATETQTFVPVSAFKASAANTITTIAAPAATSVIWRINVSYFTAT